MKTKEQVDKRITELYSQIATSRAGVSDSQSELAELIKKYTDNVPFCKDDIKYQLVGKQRLH